MTVLDEFADLLTDTVLIEPKTSVDLYNKRTFGAGVTYDCRRQDKADQIRTADGRDVISTGLIIILGNPPIGAEDRVTVGGTVVNLLKVATYHDERGPHHTDLWYGRS